MIDGYNIFKLDLRGAEIERVGFLEGGRIHAQPCYLRDGRRLPATGFFGRTIEALRQRSDFTRIIEVLDKTLWQVPGASPENRDFLLSQHLQVLEIMVQDGWVERKVNENRPKTNINSNYQGIRSGPEVIEALRRAGRADLMRSRIDGPFEDAAI